MDFGANIAVGVVLVSPGPVRGADGLGELVLVIVSVGYVVDCNVTRREVLNSRDIPQLVILILVIQTVIDVLLCSNSQITVKM